MRVRNLVRWLKLVFYSVINNFFVSAVSSFRHSARVKFQSISVSMFLLLSSQCFLWLIISLHLSAYWHQSRQDGSFSGLPTSLLHVSHTPVSSSLQISTLPPQWGHGKYSGLGRRNFFIPGHDSALEPSKHFTSPAATVSLL